EPFASLDAQTRELMQEELLQIWAKASKTVLFVTHQIDEAIYLSDRVVVFSGRPGTVKASIPIDIARPRALGVKREARFHAIEDRSGGLNKEDSKGDRNRRPVDGPDSVFNPRGGGTQGRRKEGAGKISYRGLVGLGARRRGGPRRGRRADTVQDRDLRSGRHH